jgi:hypothetical protein
VIDDDPDGPPPEGAEHRGRSGSVTEPAIVASVLGISSDTAGAARDAGAELLVAGSALLTHPEGKRAAVAELRRALAEPASVP